MRVIGLRVLVSNVASVLLLMRDKDGDAHVGSVWLGSRNDAIGNVAARIASCAVFVADFAWPDLLVTMFMAGLFLRTAPLIFVQTWQEYHMPEISVSVVSDLTVTRYNIDA